MSYNDALKLEVSILEALLQRNRCGHGKAKYFQRTSMALRAILRANLVDFSPTVDNWKIAIVERKEAQENSSGRKKCRKQQQQQQEDELWDLSSLRKDAVVSAASAAGVGRLQFLLLDSETADTLKIIKATLQTNFPEIISRIEFASDPLFLEISRGFFLPFCTIALGALGRIRILLMRIGHHVLDALQDVQRMIEQHQSSQETTTTASSVVAHAKNLFFTPQDMVELRTWFTESPNDQLLSGPPARRERLRRLRKIIGINDSKTLLAEATKDAEDATKHSGDTDLEAPSLDNIKGAGNLTKPTTTSRENDQKYPKEEREKDDIGQPVLAMEELSETRPDQQDGAKLSSQPTLGVDLSWETMSNELKQKNKQSSKEEKKKNKEKECTMDEPTTKKRPRSSKASSGVKKEKKKKRKQKDFFDDLFD